MPAYESLWQPPEHWIRSTLIGELCQRVGVASFEALRHASLVAPDSYWSTVASHLDFRWRNTPTRLVDLSAGAAFPYWFPGGELNWVDNVLANARGAIADQAAVIAENEVGEVTSVSYRALARDVCRLAAGLRARGIHAGDRVGLMMAMGSASATAFLGIAAIGAIAVPLFTGFGADAAAARLRLAGATWLLASGGYSRRGKYVDLTTTLDALRASLPHLKIAVHGNATTAPSRFIDWSALFAEPLDTLPAFDANHPFMIMFTSGTTGEPKGTVHVHGGFPLKIVHDCAYHFEIRAGDRWLWPSDMGWIVGPITTVGALCRGATLVCYDGAPDHPTATRIPELMDRHRISHFGASPTLIRTLAASLGVFDKAVLDGLSVLIVAGEVIDHEHFEWYFRNVGRSRLPVINYSGGTEASGGLVANVLALPIVACGFNAVSPGVTAYAADSAGEKVMDRPGEMVIDAPFVGMTAGFWLANDRYLETYWNALPGRWSHGDLLLERGDGQWFILGRTDDTLKIAGKRVGPAEVEAIVLDLPYVRDAAAVTVPHPVKGEQLVICASTSAPASDGLSRAVIKHVEAALGKPFRPAAVLFVDDLPRTRNGKIVRRLIRDVLRGTPPSDLTGVENPEALAFLSKLNMDN
ncbi:AMP-binding protein [Trinickia sp. LjRoot230]|uniref:AMP-binding protein n=1 Tax=Trinickia sp. LjRoot230 TaxID=3342288 RepID=UPI003ED110A1